MNHSFSFGHDLTNLAQRTVDAAFNFADHHTFDFAASPAPVEANCFSQFVQEVRQDVTGFLQDYCSHAGESSLLSDLHSLVEALKDGLAGHCGQAEASHWWTSCHDAM